LIGGRTSLLLPARTQGGERLFLPADWSYLPLREFGSRAKAADLAAVPVPGADAGSLRSETLAILGFITFIEHFRQGHVAHLDAGIRLSRILHVFCLGYDVYSDAAVEKCLLALWNMLAAGEFSKTLQVNEREGRRLLFVYQDVLAEYSSGSFGNTTMAKYMVLLLKQSLTVDFRLAAFKDDRFVDMCTFTASQIPHTRHFLEPSEKNRELLDVYFIALLSGRLTSEKNEFLYKIAVHHTCAFLFGDLPGKCGWVIDATQSIGGADEAKHAVEQRAGAVRQLLLAAHDELYRDVAFYQYTAAGVPSVAKDLPESRRAVLATLARSDGAAERMVRQRHPTLDLSLGM